MPKGPFKKYVTGLGGEGGQAKERQRVARGEGVKQNSDVTAYEKIF